LLKLHEAMTSADLIPDSRKPLLAAKLAGVEVQLLTLCAMERRYVDAWAAGKSPGAEASLLKIRGTEILQAMTELAMELEGPMANAHDPADLHKSPEALLSGAQRASAVANEYLYSRCWSIFGGTNEIQRNIIARQILSS
jgi:alkylation response protein AidB-like acyl-CoA dehydrogenase